MATFVTCLGAEDGDMLNELPFASRDDEKNVETVLKRVNKCLLARPTLSSKDSSFTRGHGKKEKQ